MPLSVRSSTDEGTDPKCARRDAQRFAILSALRPFPLARVERYPVRIIPSYRTLFPAATLADD
jgi:hypothetical protein